MDDLAVDQSRVVPGLTRRAAIVGVPLPARPPRARAPAPPTCWVRTCMPLICTLYVVYTPYCSKEVHVCLRGLWHWRLQ